MTASDSPTPGDEASARVARRPMPIWQRALPWLITLACFAYLYGKLAGAAGREGETVVSYLVGIFASVPWGRWLASLCAGWPSCPSWR